MEVRIYPLNTGFIKLDKGVYVTGGRGYGEEIEVPAWAFLITDGKENILVDTGMSATENADRHHPGSYQPEGFRIDAQLKKMGLEVEEINTIIFTHLHWDHCANLPLFRNARCYVHAAELAFALDPHILYYKSYSSPKAGMTPTFADVAFQTVAGEYAYNDFVALFPTPGHCPGHQSVAVKTAKGLYVIAGDAVFADENLQPDVHRNLPFTPMGRFVNVFDMYASMAKIIQRADHVLTGHGRGVGRQAVYP
ncbi:MAG: N-acyl homoserine lactonase family protein [Desulfobacterales bacterium]|nr:MAG: N-acyl homoserine lactonase family protein [Desulfobacterales bacterium]